MKILEIVNFSAGISGVWTRALEDAKAFKDIGHEVYVYSSNETENGEIVDDTEEILEGINIKRFPIKKRKGYALWFNFKKEALKLNPDIIIAHGLRKPYLNKVVKLKKLLGCKIFLITHAPFIDKESRSKKLNLIIWFYDKFLGKRIMNSFDKVITICRWEEETLLNLGCDKERIIYIPNSLPDEFFTQEKIGRKEGIFYLGRISKIKDLEILDLALSNLDMTADAIGPLEKNYHPEFKSIQIKNPIYNLKEKIKEMGKYEIFVLPSKREAFPFVLLEAMARGKIVIASRTKGAEELINNGRNGFLFEIGNYIKLKEVLGRVSNLDKVHKEKIKKKAMKNAKRFKILNTIQKWEKLFNEDER